MSGRARTAVGTCAWLTATALVVLGSRALAYALAPQPSLIGSRLEYEAGGPRLVVLALAAIALALVPACLVVWLVAVGVSERARLEPLFVPIPAISGRRIAARALGLWCSSSIAFALVESYLHWRAGLGWHGIRCLVGPVHRDAIPILAGLSILASALFGAASHLVRWMRRVVAALRGGPTRLRAVAAPTARPATALVRSSSSGRPCSPRAPPLFISTRDRPPLRLSISPVMTSR